MQQVRVAEVGHVQIQVAVVVEVEGRDTEAVASSPKNAQQFALIGEALGIEAGVDLVCPGEAVRGEQIQTAVLVEIAPGDARGVAVVAERGWRRRLDILSTLVLQELILGTVVDEIDIQIAVIVRIDEGAAQRLIRGYQRGVDARKSAISLVREQQCRLLCSQTDHQQIGVSITIIIAKGAAIGLTEVDEAGLSDSVGEGDCSGDGAWPQDEAGAQYKPQEWHGQTGSWEARSFHWHSVVAGAT